MKKWMALSIALNAALLGLVGIDLLDRRAEAAAGGGGLPVANGNVNGDGSLDVSDAIYILFFLFMDGPAPVPLECTEECPEVPPAGGLPVAGQTICYDDRGIPIDCGSPDFPGQEGSFQAGCPKEDRFSDLGDGTVADACTGLEWQQDPAPGTYTWGEALRYCDGLVLRGHDDWRLPTVRELGSIIDYGSLNPAVDPLFRAGPDWYWSSTTFVGDPDHAWYVRFWDGYVYVDPGFGKDKRFFVRAVRSIGPGE